MPCLARGRPNPRGLCLHHWRHPDVADRRPVRDALHDRHFAQLHIARLARRCDIHHRWGAWPSDRVAVSPYALAEAAVLAIQVFVLILLVISLQVLQSATSAEALYSTVTELAYYVNAGSIVCLAWVLLAFAVDGLHMHPKYQDMCILAFFTLWRSVFNVVCVNTDYSFAVTVLQLIGIYGATLTAGNLSYLVYEHSWRRKWILGMNRRAQIISMVSMVIYVIISAAIISPAYVNRAPAPCNPELFPRVDYVIFPTFLVCYAGSQVGIRRDFDDDGGNGDGDDDMVMTMQQLLNLVRINILKEHQEASPLAGSTIMTNPLELRFVDHLVSYCSRHKKVTMLFPFITAVGRTSAVSWTKSRSREPFSTRSLRITYQGAFFP
jgi:hypothetical protein